MRLASRALLSVRRSLCTSTRAAEPVNFVDLASRLNVRLTEQEMASLSKQLDRSGDGTVQRAELEDAGRKRLELMWTRDVLLSAIETPRTALDRLGNRMIDCLDYAGTALFACVGVQIAGSEAGMNLVGSLLVGWGHCPLLWHARAMVVGR